MKIDPAVPPANGRLLAETLPIARLVTLSDASRIFFADRPGKAVRRCSISWRR